MDMWYAILQMMEYIKDIEVMLLPEGLKRKFKNMADTTDRVLKEKWARIQQIICTIIHQDVCNRYGAFFYGHTLPSNEQIELHLDMSREDMPFNSLEGCRPFPKKPTI
jgi:hypothetical protein